MEGLLRQREQFEDTISRPEVLVRNVRLGVTELTALTWLPVLVGRIRERYPSVSIEPDVDLSAGLRDMLANDKVDVIVLPDVFEHPDCIRTPLACTADGTGRFPVADARRPVRVRRDPGALAG